MSALRPVVHELDVQAFTEDQVVAAAVLQGLANRLEPRVYLSMGDRYWTMRLDGRFRPEGGVNHTPGTVARYRSCTDIWREYYGRAKSLEFQPVGGLGDLLEKVRDAVRGVILYRREERGEAVVVATMAGLRDAVPVTAELLASEPSLAALPVLDDLRGRFPDAVAAQRWAARELQPRCSREGVYSTCRTANEGDPDYFALDWVVARKLFAFNLGFYRSKTPEEFELAEEILSHYPLGTPMYGWGTSESSMMVGMAKSGHFLVCTHTPNISFHAGIRPRSTRFRQIRKDPPAEVVLEKKHYVTFLVNEGDTLKWMGSAMGHGQWLEPERGTLPVNWGVNAWLVDAFPGLMEMFYDTMSANDRFVSAITGYGYYNPKLSRATDLLARKEAERNPASDLTVGTVYAVHGMIDAANGILDEATDRWLVRRGCAGYVFESAQQSYVKFTSAGQPLIGVDWALFYWMHRFEGPDRPAQAAARIREIAAENEAPFFIPVYSGSPSQFARIAALLPPDQFKVVLLDEMVELARLAGPRANGAAARASVPSAKPRQEFRGTVVAAPRATLTVDGDVRKWDALGCGTVEHDLARWGVGTSRARYRWAWDEQHLHVLVEELGGPDRPIESWDARGYEADEFDFVDGVAFWMDFTGAGTLERGGFTPWFGFSSRGRTDLYCCQLNNRTLSSPFPPARIATSGRPGHRLVEAAIRWRDLALALDPAQVPSGGLGAAIAEGFRFGCQPLLIEGRRGRAFLNGRSNKRQDKTAAALASDGDHRVLAPDGFDADSLCVELHGKA